MTGRGRARPGRDLRRLQDWRGRALGRQAPTQGHRSRATSSLPCRRSQFLTGYGGVQKAGSRTPFQNSFGGETALTQPGGPRGLSVCHAGIWLWGAALAPGFPPWSATCLTSTQAPAL